MVANPSPNPKNNMWDFIAYYLRFYRHNVAPQDKSIFDVLRTSRATVSRLENGQKRLDGRDAASLDKAWNTGGLFTLLVWYASIGHDPQWFAQYFELERKAGLINTFNAHVPHGLVQTEDYARALLLCGDASQADRLLRERIERQLVLNREPAPHMSMVVSQNALEWPVGSPEIVRAQLARLLEVSELSNFTVRVVPRAWQVGAYQGLDGSFTMMTGDDFGIITYTESPEGGRLVSTPSEVASFAVRYDRISGKALPEGPSRDLIKEIMEAFA